MSTPPRNPQDETTPRWVKGFVIAAVVLFALMLVAHIAFGGLGHHHLG